MKLGKVLAYKDIDEAKALIGKKVLASNVQALIESDKKCEEEGYPPDYKMIGILREVNDKYLHPYQCYHQTLIGYQFIREVIEDQSDQSEYEPYDFDDPQVRDSLKGKQYKDKSDASHSIQIVSFYKDNYEEQGRTRSEVRIGYFNAEEFLRECVWLDGTPCGKKKKKERPCMSAPTILEQLSSLESKIREFRSKINKAYRDLESSSEEYDQGMTAAYKRMVLQLDKVLPVRDGEMGFPFLA